MTADPVRLAIVGCGGMGRRHLAGLAELARCGERSVRLVAACDLNERNAHDLAAEADVLLGDRPAVFTDVGAMVRESDGVEAACTTDFGSHHLVASEHLDLGMHTLCEKPPALTSRGCTRVMAAERSGQVLPVAENVRRDPINRLARAARGRGHRAAAVHHGAGPPGLRRLPGGQPVVSRRESSVLSVET